MNLRSSCHVIVLCLSLYSFSSLSAWAQMSEDEVLGRPSFGAAGKLFSVNYDNSQKQIKLGLAGKSASTIDLESGEVEVFGKVIGGPESGRPLKLVRIGTAYQIQDKLAPDSTVEIRVHEKSTDRNETHRFKIKP